MAISCRSKKTTAEDFGSAEINVDNSLDQESKLESKAINKSKSLNRTFLPPPPSHLLEETIQ